MLYVIDAHALIWHLTNDAKLGANARTILTRIDAGKAKALCRRLSLPKFYMRPNVGESR